MRHRTLILCLTAAGCSGGDRPAAGAGTPAPGDTGRAVFAPVPAQPDSLVMTPADSAPVLAFVVNTGGADVGFDPIGYVRGDSVTQVPLGEDGDSGVVAFNALWYRRGLTYRLFSRGAEVGRAAVFNSSEPGCVGLGAVGMVDPDSVRAHPLMIATNGRSYRSRPVESAADPSPAERGAVLREARAALGDSIPAPYRDSLAIRSVTAWRLPGTTGRLLLANLAASGDTFSLDKRLGTTRVAVLIAIEGTGNAWKRTLAVVEVGTEEELTRHELVDFFDFDKDGSMEIVIANGYYESQDYSVWRRRGDRWFLLSRTGGGGC